jgi:hypothetical protein
VGGFSKAQKSDIEKGDINMSRKKKGSVPVAPPKQEKKRIRERQRAGQVS